MDLLFHLILYVLIVLACLFGIVLITWVIFLIWMPIDWVNTKLSNTRCPRCKGFFKRKLVDSEMTGEREVLRTVNRMNKGTLYSNSYFEPDQAIVINRQEQVTFVEQTIQKTWECKDPACGHQWQTDECLEYEGSL